MHSAPQIEPDAAPASAPDTTTREPDFAAAQAFLLSAKHFWTTSLYRRLRQKYESLTEKSGTAALAPNAAVTVLKEDVTYHFFAWLERHLQRMKYSSRYGLVPFYSERGKELLDSLGVDLDDEYAPAVEQDFELPKYYKSLDFHQHEGGLWSEATAGLAYEHGARTTTLLLGDSHEDLHNRFTDFVAGDQEFGDILDLGCGFGKSTRPFVKKFPSARVEAVELSAPCLYVAAHFAREGGTKNVNYSQQDARHTCFPDSSFDLVTSTMLLHEMPVESIRALFRDCFRLLRPGGKMAHLDFYILSDAFDHFMHYGHSKRNNEIFMRGVVEMDMQKELEDIGFSQVAIEPFKESPNVDLDQRDAWRFPWTSICAVKP